MKKHFKLVLLVVLFTCTTLPAWSQATTEGTEFWVALTLSANPEGGAFNPYIAISTQDWEGGHVTVTCPSNPQWAGIQNRALEEAWTIISTRDMANSNWYNENFTAEADGQAKNRGILVQADRKVSVFCAWQGDKSFDAANILPAAVLRSKYIVQDYPPYDNNGKTSYSTFAIVATEDNTIVDITPSQTTYDNKPANVPYSTPLLMKGQVYHVLSSKENTLSGTIVEARDNKKIAVFNGDVMTRVPDKKMGNRDLLYEQAMPTDYWGREFVVTRSLRSDANRVRITAIEDDTKITIDGIEITTINSTETYEFELAKTGFTPKSNRESPTPDIIYSDVAYIETSCPCATYLYDVGKDYRMNNGSENENEYGDPSMVWMSPLEQRIEAITFGLCGTNVTKDHFINIIKRTKDTSVKLVDKDGNIKVDNTAAFIPVPGNSQYSYFRIQLVDNLPNVKDAYTLTSDSGIIAHVYGNGVSESYAYSVGSTTKGREIKVNNASFKSKDTDFDIAKAPTFCVGDSLLFAPQDISETIYRVVWDFGDGTSKDTTQASFKHAYTSPGWYDAQAILFGEEFCSHPAFTDTIAITFRVVRPDTIVVNPTLECLSLQQQADSIAAMGQEAFDKLIAEGQKKILNPDAPCYETRQLSLVKYGLETMAKDANGVPYSDTYKDTLHIPLGDKDEVYVAELGKSLAYSLDTTKISDNEYNCNHYHPYYVHIIACLRMDAENDPKKLFACKGEDFNLPFTKKRGDATTTHITITDLQKGEIETSSNAVPPAPAEVRLDTTLSWKDAAAGGLIIENTDGNSGTYVLPTGSLLEPGRYELKIILTDANEECGDKPFEITRTITIKYPESVVVQKFVNVLAVLNAQYNGGYDFVGFQWYKNGEIIPGETGAVYHTIAPFSVGDTYSVELTDAAGNKLPSCDFEIKTEPGYNTIQEEGEEEPAQKLIQNNRIVIRRDGQTYNIFGQKVR